MITYTLLFASIVFISEKFYPHEALLYTTDEGELVIHDLPRETVFDEQGYIRYEIFDIYGF